MRKLTVKLIDTEGNKTNKGIDKLPNATVSDEKYKALGTAVANLYGSRVLNGLTVMTYETRDIAID